MENHRVNGSSSYKFKSDSSVKPTSKITSRVVRLLGLIITVLILGEYVLPILYYYNWDVPARRQNYDEVRILLLSDPHVEGYSPALHHLNYILQYDSDRYLRENFRRALIEVDPELVVILGDLLDRGSIATDKEFVDSCARFREIFLTSHNVPYFIIPGDNDIGGEGLDFITEAKSSRFEECFGNYTGAKVLSFVEVRSATRGSLSRHLDKHSDIDNSGRLRIFISHRSIIHFSRNDLKEATSTRQSCLFVSGHNHHANLVRRVGSNGTVVPERLSVGTTNLDIHRCLNHPMNEDFLDAYGLSVPSCTYRSGYPKANAYMFLRVFRNQNVSVVILPIPNRYSAIFLYLFTFLIFLTYVSLSHSRYTKGKIRVFLYFLVLTSVLLCMKLLLTPSSQRFIRHSLF